MLESQTQMKKAAANAGVQPKERQTSPWTGNPWWCCNRALATGRSEER